MNLTLNDWNTIVDALELAASVENSEALDAGEDQHSDDAEHFGKKRLYIHVRNQILRGELS